MLSSLKARIEPIKPVFRRLPLMQWLPLSVVLCGTACLAVLQISRAQAVPTASGEEASAVRWTDAVRLPLVLHEDAKVRTEQAIYLAPAAGWERARTQYLSATIPDRARTAAGTSQKTTDDLLKERTQLRADIKRHQQMILKRLLD